MKTFEEFKNGWEKTHNKNVKINSTEFKKIKITWLLLNERIEEAATITGSNSKLLIYFKNELKAILSELSENAHQKALMFIKVA